MTGALETVVSSLQDDATAHTVERLTVGDAALLVELQGPDGPTAGLAHRPPGEPPQTGESEVGALLSAAATPANDTAGRLWRAIGIATANALSAPRMDWHHGDPMALLADDVDQIVTVGLFRPAFRKFDDVAVNVIEREPVERAPDPAGVRLRTFEPDETARAMAGADVVFLTGSAFIYGGAERYIDAAPPSATLVLVGATTSFLPAPLFEAGVDVVAGGLVADSDRVRAAVEKGACGTDLHDAGLEKVYVATASGSEIQLSSTDSLEGSNV